MTEAQHFGMALPIRGVVGDQQAALDRSSLLSARHGQIDLRHRLLSSS